MSAPLGALIRGDTIAAIASAPGRGAIATVRVSGPRAEEIARQIAAPWPETPRCATRCTVRDPERGEVLDDAMVTVFPGPRSYTGETVVEFGTHGGTFVPAAVLAALVHAGARPAEPGEFTERAVLNGKMDLVRAEAVADLIDARSRAQHRTAISQLHGALSTHLVALRDELLTLDALLAFDIDFPEEDAGALPRARVDVACELVLGRLETLLATVPAAVLGREGAMVVLAGAPNAGKSSLLNALIGEARVIVSEVPGTTRDAVEVLLEHDPWPLRLVDTAGLRDSEDPVERLGIQVSTRYLAQAHVVLACADTRSGLATTTTIIRSHTDAPVVSVLTKGDLVSNSNEIAGSSDLSVVSAVTGDGLTALLAAITAAVASSVGTLAADTPVVTRARHRAALTHARDELLAFRAAWSGATLPAPVAAVYVRAAVHALDELIGAVDVEEVFARVFSTFCVGK